VTIAFSLAKSLVTLSSTFMLKLTYTPPENDGDWFSSNPTSYPERTSMDDADVQALAALQANGALSERIRLRGMMAACPHCHQGFGSASLTIHVRRCRALLPPTEEEEIALEAAEQEKLQPNRRKGVRSLVDLYVGFGVDATRYNLDRQ